MTTTPGTICQWFALCTNPATGTLDHPKGPTPVCDRCREKHDDLASR